MYSSSGPRRLVSTRDLDCRRDRRFSTVARWQRDGHSSPGQKPKREVEERRMFPTRDAESAEKLRVPEQTIAGIAGVGIGGPGHDGRRAVGFL